MPQNIGNHGLYCPDFDDYAAVALYMQDLGTKIDAALQGQLDELNEFLAPPMMILTNSAAVVMPAGVSVGIDNLFDTVVLNTSTFMSYDFTVNQLLIGSPAGTPSPVTYPRGAYSAGISTRMSATGAVTVGSERSIELTVTDNTLPFTQQTLVRPTDFTIDQNTGGNEGVLAKSNFMLSGSVGVDITHLAFHANAASTVNIPAGSSFLWVLYNGATDIIEVA